MRTSFALFFLIFVTDAAFAASKTEDTRTVTVGPWSIAQGSKTAAFESCTMSRSTGEFTMTFVRDQHGLSMLLNSSRWKLNRGKSYPVRLVAGSRSVDAQALAERKSVTVSLENSRLISNLRKADVLQVRGEGATIRVPLDESAAAFDRLETCFGKRETVETNPFVAPTNPFAKERNPFVAETRKPKQSSHRTVPNYSFPFPIFSTAHSQ